MEFSPVTVKVAYHILVSHLYYCLWKLLESQGIAKLVKRGDSNPRYRF